MEILEKAGKKMKALSLRDKALIALSLSANIGVLIYVSLDTRDAAEIAGIGYLSVALANLLNSATLFSPVPAFVATFIAARTLDPIFLVLLTTVMVTIGESLAYFLGDGVEDLVREYRWHQQIKVWFDKAPFIFLVVWIALPNPVQTFGQVFAGTARYPFWKYVLATFLGNLIWMTVVVKFGQWFFDLGLFL